MIMKIRHRNSETLYLVRRTGETFSIGTKNPRGNVSTMLTSSGMGASAKAGHF